MARMTRRGAFAGAGGAVLATLAGCPSETPAADAPLLALSRQFMALQVQVDAADRRETDPTDEEMYALVEERARIMDEMNGLTATTLAGHRARAATLEKWYTRGRSGRFDAVVEWDRIGPLFRDLLSEVGS